MRLNEAIRALLARFGRTEQTSRSVRGRVDHVIIVDGTMSSLEPGHETNAGLTFRLLSEVKTPRISVRYEAGVQWRAWRSTMDVIEGRGIDRQIRRIYGVLAAHYRPGDRIFLFGYSRGAYAVRALAGVIDRVGLLRADCATERNVEIAWRHYRRGTEGAAHRAFAKRLCHAGAAIEMVGVWDTVRVAGTRGRVRGKPSRRDAVHDLALGPATRHGFHALALDERRTAYAPMLWTCPEGWAGHVEQMWFRGTHGDVGGQLSGDAAARPLANIPLVWMLGKAEACGLALPKGWRARFPCDAQAPSIGMNRGWGKIFVQRRARRVGADPSEAIHPTADAPPPARTRQAWSGAPGRQRGA